jgi:hypothetical protein
MLRRSAEPTAKARGKPVHIIFKVVIRMNKWLAYVVPSA